MSLIKTPEQVDKMRRSADLLSTVLNALDDEALPGKSAKYLDDLAEEMIRDGGGIPAFKGYTIPGLPSFPASICFARNHVLVHGIPTEEEVIEDGDLINVCDSVSSINEAKARIGVDMMQRDLSNDCLYMYVLYEEDYNNLDYQNTPESTRLYWEELCH